VTGHRFTKDEFESMKPTVQESKNPYTRVALYQECATCFETRGQLDDDVAGAEPDRSQRKSRRIGRVDGGTTSRPLRTRAAQRFQADRRSVGAGSQGGRALRPGLPGADNAIKGVLDTQGWSLDLVIVSLAVPGLIPGLFGANVTFEPALRMAYIAIQVRFDRDLCA
jgi:hypothetical protein